VQLADVEEVRVAGEQEIEVRTVAAKVTVAAAEALL
jgi:hypothetical protein